MANDPSMPLLSYLLVDVKRDGFDILYCMTYYYADGTKRQVDTEDVHFVIKSTKHLHELSNEELTAKGFPILAYAKLFCP